MHFWIAILLIAGLWGELPIVVSPLPAGWTPPSREPYEFSGVAAHTKHWIFADFKIGLENQILRPRVAKRRPKPSPNLPKWSPRLIKIQVLKDFWSNFFACKICVDLVFAFSGNFAFFKTLDPYKTLRGRSIFEDQRFLRKCEKSSKILPRTFPKSSRNPRKIQKNRAKNEKNR